MNESELRAKHSEEAEELRRQLGEKDKILKTYRKEHGKLQTFFHDVKKAIKPITPIPYSPMKSTGGAPIVPVLHVTDGHMGAVQEPSEIEGFNAFSPDIADYRNLMFVRKAIEWAGLHTTVYNIKECVVLMTGDLISGDIHDELKITNAFPAPVQVVRAAQSHAIQIGMLASKFEKVTVHFITEDNHSRLTRKPQAKEAGYNSFNYLVAELLSAYLDKHDNVELNIYPMLEKVVDVNGRKYLISHGHGVRGWMGIPWYGIERRVGRESQARMQIIMNEKDKADTIGFHKFVFGHFHTPFNSPLYSCGGSVSGTDAYDHQCGRYGKPSQSAWLVHPTHGEFNRVDFDLTSE